MSVEKKSKRVVRQIPDSWDWLDAIAGTLDEDFIQAVLESSHDARAEAPEQDATDELFR